MATIRSLSCTYCLSICLLSAWCIVAASASSPISVRNDESTATNLATTSTLRQTSSKSCGTPPFEQCSFTDNLNFFNRQRWQAHHQVVNGVPFDSWWSKFQARILPKWGKLALGVGNAPKYGKKYASGQVLSNRWYGYGCYQVRMRPISVPGVLSTFFIYTGKYDAAPGRPKRHAEIDIEFVYRRKLGKIALQSNYFTNSTGYNEKFHFPRIVPQDNFNNYGFKFTSKKIEWYANGKLLRTASSNIPTLEDGPFRIFMNVWVAGPKAYVWAGRYQHKKGVATIYDKIRYTKGENCQIGATF